MKSGFFFLGYCPKGSFFWGGVAVLYLLHLTGRVIISCHAAALLFDLHGSCLQETISDRPLGHIPSAVTANLHL